MPGNHEYWSKVSFGPIAKVFAATGGAWLLDQQVRTRDSKVTITGLTCQSYRPAPLLPVVGTRISSCCIIRLREEIGRGEV